MCQLPATWSLGGTASRRGACRLVTRYAGGSQEQVRCTAPVAAESLGLPADSDCIQVICVLANHSPCRRSPVFHEMCKPHPLEGLFLQVRRTSHFSCQCPESSSGSLYPLPVHLAIDVSEAMLEYVHTSHWNFKRVCNHESTPGLHSS